MSELIKLNGCVLSASPVGENDKRIVLETSELGRITAFSRGCRRTSSPLMAASNPFAMGEFSVVSGSSAYRLAEANIKDYFRELTSSQPEVFIGFYFLDLVDYYGREGIPGTDMLNLLYYSLKSLLNKNIDNGFIRRAFELRLIYDNGEYAPNKETLSDETYTLIDRITRGHVSRIFSLETNEETMNELDKTAERVRRRAIDRRLKSLDIMESMLN